MLPQQPPGNWISIDHLRARFTANLAALAKRYPGAAKTLAEWVSSREYFILVAGDHLVLGAETDRTIQPLPTVLSAMSAVATADKMFPEKKCDRAALVAGEDLGWLWNRLYRLPCNVSGLPGYRPPLFYLMKDFEQLRTILHVQDWSDLLADARVRLFLGEDCAAQFRSSLTGNINCVAPSLWVTVNPDFWPSGFVIENAVAESRNALSAELALVNEKVQQQSRSRAGELIGGQRLPGSVDRPLRVLGITSRYTSFLQHSMRDWLDAFNRLGHTTRLEIEAADHELANTLTIARSCLEFDPDLIVAIDHYRKSLNGVSADTPVVMWIQDALPALFNTQAGADQGPLDFVMSIDPLKMVHEFGYPPDRMMSALIGVNDARFNIPAVHISGSAEFACDVCFVSHASTHVDVLLQKYLSDSKTELEVHFWTQLFASLKKIYAQGQMVTNPIILRRMIEQTILDARVSISPDQIKTVEFFFGSQVNNLLFRHQSLQWLADAGVNLHLYGNGWENHPTLARFARGPADNQTALAGIYRSSRINLHVSPHGAVHQRVMEGLAAGGFFMLRYCAGDTLEILFRKISDYCRESQINTEKELQERATPDIQAALEQVEQILQENPFKGPWSFIETLRSAEENGYVRGAASVWRDDYDAVNWNSAAELLAKVDHFLRDENDRRQRAESMRKVVLERFTYLETTRRLINFVHDRLRHSSST